MVKVEITRYEYLAYYVEFRDRDVSATSGFV